MYTKISLHAAPTTAPANPVNTSSADVCSFADEDRNIYLIIEDAAAYNTALSSVELEVFGYKDATSAPVNIYSGVVSNSFGRCLVPLPDQTPNFAYLYFRQTGTLGTTGGTNAPIKYEVVVSAQ